jgi:outer membrane usher protein
MTFNVIALLITAALMMPDIAYAENAAQESNDAQVAVKLMPVDVVVNNSEGGQWILLQRNGILYAPEEAFVEWRLNISDDAQSVEYRGQKWIPLTAVPGFESRFDYANQSMEMVFSPKAFEATRLTSEPPPRPQLSPANTAAFLNYDLTYTGSSYSEGPGNRDLGVLGELGVSNNWGVLTSSFTGYNVTGSSRIQERRWLRLETTYSRDFLDDNTTLKIGDSSTRRATWGRPVYFGGLQFGRNFSLTPGFISQPIPVISGTSTAPSTVELYVNDVLRQTSKVPSGPFAIDNFPLITGSGNARIVVRDVLGRETVIEQPFFTHSSLLEEGLTDWSGELGKVRRNLGSKSFDYGQAFASGMIRHGMNKTLTLEGQGEWGEQTRDIGFGVNYALPIQALGQFSYSLSDNKSDGSGNNWRLGIETYGLRHSYSARVEKASRNYRELGLESVPYKSQASGSYSYTSDNHGQLSLGVVRIDSYVDDEITTYSGNYSIRVRGNSALTFTAARAIGGSTSGYSFGISFLMPLDRQTNFSSNVTHKSGQTDAYVSASKGLRAETGTGWRALAGMRGGNEYGEGGYYYQGSKVLLTSDASASSNQQTLRLGAKGGMVAMDKRLFMSRSVNDSFALVEVPGYANVGIGFQNNTLTRTDKDGVALLPRLLPYQRNSIRLNPNELPISAELDTIEQVVVPAARSGVKVVFPVRTGRGALIHVTDENGENAPAGAVIKVEGDEEEFYMARRGQVFVTGLQNNNTLHMTWDNNSCTFEVNLPPANPDDIARIGPVTCLEGNSP